MKSCLWPSLVPWQDLSYPGTRDAHPGGTPFIEGVGDLSRRGPLSQGGSVPAVWWGEVEWDGMGWLQLLALCLLEQ